MVRWPQDHINMDLMDKIMVIKLMEDGERPKLRKIKAKVYLIGLLV